MNRFDKLVELCYDYKKMKGEGVDMENFEPNFTEETVVLNEEVVEPVAEEKGTAMGLISMILGIASIVVCCSGFPFAVAAIVLALIERSKLGETSKKGKVGLILGIIGAVIGVIVYILAFIGGFAGGMMGY